MTWRGVAVAVSLLLLGLVLVGAVVSSGGPVPSELTPQTAPQQPLIFEGEADDD